VSVIRYPRNAFKNLLGGQRIILYTNIEFEIGKIIVLYLLHQKRTLYNKQAHVMSRDGPHENTKNVSSKLQTGLDMFAVRFTLLLNVYCK